MSDGNPILPEKNNQEKDINGSPEAANFTRENILVKKREVTEKEKTREEQKEKEISKEQEKIRENAGIPETKQRYQPPPPPPKKPDKYEKDLQAIMVMDKPKQVKALVVLSFKKGIRHAIAVAEKLNNPYLLDELHDTLVDELYNELIKNKKLKKYQ